LRVKDPQRGGRASGDSKALGERHGDVVQVVVVEPH
jgi:hypothetical protein